MTQKQFDEQQWSTGMQCHYKGHTYDIVSVDFVERLVSIINPDSEDNDDAYWVRCENVEIIHE